MSTVKQAINAEKSKGVTISFELRSEKKDKDGKTPVRLIYQIKGQRTRCNTGQSILPECWDKKNQQSFYIDKKTAKQKYPLISYELFFTETQAKEFNEKLTDVIKETKKITDRMVMDKIVFDAEMVIEKLKENKTATTKKTEPTNIVFDFIDQYLIDNKATREPGSLSVYNSNTMG